MKRPAGWWKYEVGWHKLWRIRVEPHSRLKDENSDRAASSNSGVRLTSMVRDIYCSDGRK